MRSNSNSFARRAVLSAALLLACATGAAQDSPDTAAEAGSSAVAPEAVAAVERMQTYIHGLKAYAVHAETTEDEVLPFGYKLQGNQSVDLLVQLPSQLRVDISGDDRDQTYLLDGATFTMHAKRLGVYTQAPVTATLDQAVGKLLSDGVEMPLIDVIYQGTKGTLLEGARAGRVVGESRIDGVLCDHLAFRQATIDWQIWIAQGDQPLPKKLLITTRYEVGDPQFEAELTWDIAPKIGGDSFAFKAPSDARKIPWEKGAHSTADATGGQP